MITQIKFFNNVRQRWSVKKVQNGSQKHESIWIDDTFVEDESVAFDMSSDFQIFSVGFSKEEGRVDDLDAASSIERLSDLVEELLSQ